jgi:hypothetical protein
MLFASFLQRWHVVAGCVRILYNGLHVLQAFLHRQTDLYRIIRQAAFGDLWKP